MVSGVKGQSQGWPAWVSTLSSDSSWLSIIFAFSILTTFIEPKSHFWNPKAVSLSHNTFMCFRGGNVYSPSQSAPLRKGKQFCLQRNRTCHGNESSSAYPYKSEYICTLLRLCLTVLEIQDLWETVAYTMLILILLLQVLWYCDRLQAS